MRCKAGDLAVIVKVTEATQHALGLIVQVEKLIEQRTYTKAFGITEPRPTWKCTLASGRSTKNYKGVPVAIFAVPDFALRPIRGDETPESIIKEQTCEHQ